MAESPIVGLRFPPELLQQIDRLVGHEGRSRTEVILNLIKRGLGEGGSDTSAILDRLDALEKKPIACCSLNKN
jgi:metal-responsive CopG/Arc/MetJ family transcriptional regulator